MAGRVIYMFLVFAMILQCSDQQRRRRRRAGVALDGIKRRPPLSMPAKQKLDVKNPMPEPHCSLQIAESNNCTCLEELLGMQDGRIQDSSITASSVYQNRDNYGPPRARLDSQDSPAGSWVADDNDPSPWIQVVFKTEVRVTGLITQGRPDADEWVTGYEVACSQDGKAWTVVTDAKGAPLTFKANADRNTQVTNSFPTARHAKYVRIMPAAWRGHRSMRFEVVGCHLIE